MTLDAQQTYKACVLSLPVPRLSVFLDGETIACDLAQQAMAKATPDGKPSLFIRASTEGEIPEFRLIARNGQYIIARSGGDRPLVAEIDGLNSPGAKLAVRRLEHIARWTQTARLSNPSSTIQPGDLRLTILVDSKEVTGNEVRLEYKLKDGKPVPPTFKVSLTNHSQRTLYCGLLDLTQRFKVDAGLLSSGGVRLEPGQTAWADNGKQISATVPDELWRQGVIEHKDLLKVIICTQPFDARLLEQPSLDMPGTKGTTRSLGRNGSLQRLMNNLQTRELGGSDPADIDDWRTLEVAFTTVRPQDTVPVPATGQTASLAGE